MLRASVDDCAELVESVNASIDELRPWMPWAQQPATDQSIMEFLDRSDCAWDACEEFQFAIRGERGDLPNVLVGFCGLHARIGDGAV